MSIGVETPSSRTFAIGSDDWFEHGAEAGASHEMVEGRLRLFLELVEVVLELLDGASDEIVVSEVSPRYGIVTEDGVYKFGHVVVEDETRKLEVVDKGGGGGRGGSRRHFNEGELFVEGRMGD